MPVSLLTTLMQMDQGTFLPRLIHQVAIAVVLLPLSLYLKSDNIGKHDNVIDISPYEEQLLDYYCCNINHLT